MIAHPGELGKTILLTTHYMDEAQALADRVVVISAGRVVADGTPDSIGGRAQAKPQIRFLLPKGMTAADLPVAGTLAGTEVVIETDKPTRALHELTGWAVSRGIELEGLTVSRPSLEDVYLALTSGDAAEEPHQETDARTR